MSLYVSRKRRTDINVIPLIDVMVVLLVFLLLTTHFDDTQSLGITPPKADSAAKSGETEISPIVLAVDRTGAIYIDAKPVTREAVAGELAALAKKTRGVTVLVVADEFAPTKDTVFALDRARLAGLSSSLVTQGAK
jgi:biopolymer transport protein ExbD